MKKKFFYLLVFSLFAWNCNREYATSIEIDTIYVRENDIPFYEALSLPTIDTVLVLDVASNQVFYRTIKDGRESDVKIMLQSEFLKGLISNNKTE